MDNISDKLAELLLICDFIQVSVDYEFRLGNPEKMAKNYFEGIKILIERHADNVFLDNYIDDDLIEEIQDNVHDLLSVVDIHTHTQCFVKRPSEYIQTLN